MLTPGTALDADTVLRITGGNPFFVSEVVDGRGGVEERGLVIVAGDSVTFRHELARRAVEGTLATSLRRHYHERVLSLLLERGDDPPAILHQPSRPGAVT